MLISLILGTLLSICLGYIYKTANVDVQAAQADNPLNETLAYYKLAGFNGKGKYLTHGFVPTACGANLSVHYTEPGVWGDQTGTASRPVLILTHGYPESSYIWRDVSAALSARTPVFIPDQPGYGLSSSCCTASGCAYDKRTYSRSILQVVKEIYGEVNVIYAGHDRGARTMHRAAVDNDYPGITGLGFFAADIVPYLTEYASFANPFWSQNYFHWAFLPKGQFATDVIMAYGGGKWVKQILEYGAGPNEQAVELFKTGQSWEIYINFFDQLAVTNASVFDYQAGAFSDYDMQLWDQGNDTKIDIPTHIMYSEYNLGAAFDVLAVWRNYTHPSAGVTVEGVGITKVISSSNRHQTRRSGN